MWGINDLQLIFMNIVENKLNVNVALTNANNVEGFFV